MDVKKIVLASMEGARLNQGGKDVVLYLDETMRHRSGRRGDGVHFLPVIVVADSAGYVEFLTPYQAQIAQWFGDEFDAAQEKVEEVNAELGFSLEEAEEVIGETFARSARNQHERHAKLRD